jgi:hypothetical protein
MTNEEADALIAHIAKMLRVWDPKSEPAEECARRLFREFDKAFERDRPAS